MKEEKERERKKRKMKELLNGRMKELLGVKSDEGKRVMEVDWI